MSLDPDRLILAAFDVGSLIARRDYINAAKRAVELGLDLVPVEDLRGYLDEAQAKKDRELAEAALAAKFPNEP